MDSTVIPRYFNPPALLLSIPLNGFQFPPVIIDGDNYVEAFNSIEWIPREQISRDVPVDGVAFNSIEWIQTYKIVVDGVEIETDLSIPLNGFGDAVKSTARKLRRTFNSIEWIHSYTVVG